MKMLRRVTAFLLIACMLCGTASAASANAFTSDIGHAVTRGQAAEAIYEHMRMEVHGWVAGMYASASQAEYDRDANVTDVDVNRPDAEAIMAMMVMFSNRKGEPGQFKPDEILTKGRLAEWTMNMLMSKYGTAVSLDLDREDNYDAAVQRSALGRAIGAGVIRWESRQAWPDINDPATKDDLEYAVARLDGPYIDIESTVGRPGRDIDGSDIIIRGQLAAVVRSILKKDAIEPLERRWATDSKAAITSMGYFDVDEYTEHAEDIYIVNALTELNGFGGRMYLPCEAVTAGELASVVNGLATFFGGRSAVYGDINYTFRQAMDNAMFWGDVAGWVDGSMDSRTYVTPEEAVYALSMVRGYYVDEDAARDLAFNSFNAK